MYSLYGSSSSMTRAWKFVLFLSVAHFLQGASHEEEGDFDFDEVAHDFDLADNQGGDEDEHYSRHYKGNDGVVLAIQQRVRPQKPNADEHTDTTKSVLQQKWTSIHRALLFFWNKVILHRRDDGAPDIGIFSDNTSNEQHVDVTEEGNSNQKENDEDPTRNETPFRMARSVNDQRNLICLQNHQQEVTSFGDKRPSSSSMEPHVGMELNVFLPNSCNALDISYELLEPLELELGGLPVTHFSDFAYTPVVVTSSSMSSSSSSSSLLPPLPENIQPPIVVMEQHSNGPSHSHDKENLGDTTKEDTFNPNALVPGTVRTKKNNWWQWWIPWWDWNQHSADSNNNNYLNDPTSPYRLHRKAFAGGSHGEVWRGRRKCTSHSDSSSDYERSNENASMDEDKNDDNDGKDYCMESLVFKRLKIEKGYRVLEAGLREIYFGEWLANHQQQQKSKGTTDLFTRYVDHFFREHDDQLELWIVFQDAGRTLRSFLYTESLVGDFVLFQHSRLWTQLRTSASSKQRKQGHSSFAEENSAVAVNPFGLVDDGEASTGRGGQRTAKPTTKPQVSGAVPDAAGRQLMSSVLRQILTATAFLNDNNIVHRDIKPSNIMCQANFDSSGIKMSSHAEDPHVVCKLGDFSSAVSSEVRKMYTRGPSRAEQTDEYSPPEAIFGFINGGNTQLLSPAFDSWSIGIVALELLLGTPNVFSVDQRTRAVLTTKLQKEKASNAEIERALYLAALSQFCIYNPTEGSNRLWPLRQGDPLYKTFMTKESCTLDDFHRSLRARDPLGWGFETSDALLHLVWQLLAWDPQNRMTAAEALKHPYFSRLDTLVLNDLVPGEHNALETPHEHFEPPTTSSSETKDPKSKNHTTSTPQDPVDSFACPKCGRSFGDWRSCQTHARSRKHAKFCSFDRTRLPTCIHSHSMLPAHSGSGYCDIQGRRRVIEDFHAIHLNDSHQFYGIFDGHTGNVASKYAASFLYSELSPLVTSLTVPDMIATGEHKNASDNTDDDWKDGVRRHVEAAFSSVHTNFLNAVSLKEHVLMDQSGTTATALLVANGSLVVGSIGDSRAVVSRRVPNDEDDHGKKGFGAAHGGSTTDYRLVSVQLTKDHVASDPEERALVELRGGSIFSVNGVDRVNGTLVVTRSIGDSDLAPFLSRTPDVIVMKREEVQKMCGVEPSPNPSSRHLDSPGTNIDMNKEVLPCFMVLASDGLWDVMSNDDVVAMVAEVILSSTNETSDWKDTASLQQAAEVLTLEAFVRGSTDNIGVCIVSLLE